MEPSGPDQTALQIVLTILPIVSKLQVEMDHVKQDLDEVEAVVATVRNGLTADQKKTLQHVLDEYDAGQQRRVHTTFPLRVAVVGAGAFVTFNAIVTIALHFWL